MRALSFIVLASLIAVVGVFGCAGANGDAAPTTPEAGPDQSAPIDCIIDAGAVG